MSSELTTTTTTVVVDPNSGNSNINISNKNNSNDHGGGVDIVEGIWFEDDDEQTLGWLLSRTWHEDIPNRIEGLLRRLLQDVDPMRVQSFWQKITTLALEVGFESIGSLEVVVASVQQQHPLDSSGTVVSPKPFETLAGKKHIRAVTSFLNVSERQAIQLTLSTLRSLDGDRGRNGGVVGDSGQLLSVLTSLLGTQTMLRQVIDYHYAQRLHRLGVLAECIRLKHEGSERKKENLVFLPLVEHVLKVFDSTTSYSDGRPRGIFRRLMTVICEPHVPPTLMALTPAMELEHESPQPNNSTLGSSMVASSARTPPAGFANLRWNQFVSDCVESSRIQKDLERSAAMEALFALIYDGGVLLDDFVCLLLAFHSMEFFTQLKDGSKLSQLAGLVCADCMALWRVFERPSQKVVDRLPDWPLRHPLLLGLLDSSRSDVVAQEIEIIHKLIRRLGEHALDRRDRIMAQDNVTIQLPESLALLSFGLLLSQAYQSLLESAEGSDAEAYWQTFRITGFEMARTAGNDYGALDFLQWSLDSLGGDATEPPIHRPSNEVFDWLLHDNILSVIQASQKPADAIAGASSNVGKDILVVLIATFQDTILSLDHPGAAANISMLCDLASAIFRNRPLLCDSFLAEWNVYRSAPTGSLDSDLPLCYLMNAATKLATAAVHVAVQGHSDANQFFLASVGPQLQLLASLSCSSDVVESVFLFLPAGLIRKAFVHSKKSYQTTDNATFIKNRNRVLDSINTLLRIGVSHSCRQALLHALKVEDPKISWDAPRLILGTIDSSSSSSSDDDDTEAIPLVLSITAYVLQSSRDEPRWAMNVCSSMVQARDDCLSFPRLFSSGDKKLQFAAAKTLSAMVENMSAVVFSRVVTDKEKCQYLEQVGEGVLTSFSVLTSCMSALEPAAAAAFSTAEIILLAVASFLEQLQPILQREEESIVELAATARLAVINALVCNSSLGDAIAYFSVAPIVFQLCVSMDTAYQREKMSGTGETGPNNGLSSIGQAWSRALDVKIAQAFSDSNIKFDVETWKFRKWIEPSDEDSIFGASAAAVRVMLLWASHVEHLTAENSELGPDGRPIIWTKEARLELAKRSPFQLLSSLVVTPRPIQRNPTLSHSWKSMGCSNIELLMRYFSVRRDDSEGSKYIHFAAILDLFAVYITHVKLASTTKAIGDSTPLKILRASPFIRPELWEMLFEISRIMQNSDFQVNSTEHIRLTCCLRVLRIFHAAIDSEMLLLTLLLDGTKQAEFVKILVGCVSEAIVIMERTPMEALCHDKSAILKLRFATGCLSIIQNVRACARSAPNPLAIMITKETGLFKSLWQIVVRFVSSVDANQWQESASDRSRSFVLNLFALVCDIFSTEMAWQQNQKGNISGMQTFLNDFTVGLVPILRHFTKFSGFKILPSANKQMEAVLCHSVIPSAALLSFQATPFLGHNEPDFFVQDNGFDVFAASRWFSLVAPLSTDSSALQSLVADLAAAQTIFSGEHQFLRTLLRFSSIYMLLNDIDGIALTRAALQWFRVNDKEIGYSLDELDSHALRGETNDTVCEVAELVLSATSTICSHLGSTTADSLIELLFDLCETCRKIPSLVRGSSQTSQDVKRVCRAQQCLLASAVNVRQCLGLATATAKEVNQQDQADLTLVEVACNMLNAFHQRSSHDRELNTIERNVFFTCASLLRAIISENIILSTNVTSVSLFSKISFVLRQQKIINFFVTEADSASQRVINHNYSVKPLEQAYQGKDSDLRVVSSVVSFLRVLVESRNPHLLSLFSEVQTYFITRNPLVAFATGAVWNKADLHHRGYLPIQDSAVEKRGRDGVVKNDPVHAIWINILQIMKSLLLVTNAESPTDPSSERFADIVTDFIASSRVCFISSLRASSVRPLTLNLLKETSSILSLLSEACVGGRPSRIQPDLRHELSVALHGTVSCISNFLGASGAAHELYHVLECLDNSDDAWDSSNLPNSSIRSHHPLLAAGVPNARHEGIRYAHFATQSLAVMTQADYKDYSALALADQSRDKDQSPSTLHSTIERKGRNTMNSDFQLRMEYAAAEALFHALFVIWRMHPATSAFAILAGGSHDTWTLVKPGMIIAYRSFSGSGSSSLRIAPDKYVRLARVVQVDTIRQLWHVHGLDGAGELEESVHANQLVGIENIEKRRCLFQYSPAPDSATELEQNSGNHILTLGHLILILRWCAQHKSQGLSKPIVKQLAEVCLAILCAEVSLSREIGAGTSGGDTTKRIGEQLLDLLGDRNVTSSSEISVAESGMHPPHVLPMDAKLKHFLSPSVLKAAQVQTGPELRQAFIDLETKRRKRMDHNGGPIEGGITFGGLRRSSSAFRGLRVPSDYL